MNPAFLPPPGEEPLGVQIAEELDHFGYESGPAGLMACAQPRAIVAVEILVEEEVLNIMHFSRILPRDVLEEPSGLP